MKIIFFILISLSLYANNILTNYRINGINSVEKQMDLELTKNEYWSEYLKTIDTTFGYLESSPKVLTCNKDASTLNLYIKDTNNTYSFIKTYNAFTGKIKGDKIKEGDLITPIGIYKILKKLTRENKLDSFYGPLAFVTSYPNTYDTFRGKNGHGIWIHGLPTEQTRDEFTKGCIAIDNQNIECLSNRIDIQNTILIIDANKIKQNISKEILSSILSELFVWRYAWLYDDIDAYLSFYSNKFVRNDGMTIQRFKKYKTRIFKKLEKKTIIFNNINVIPYPNSDDIYQITFKEYYKSDTFKFIGDKILIVKVDKNNKKIKIITEK
ncbi:L,D-transpeptidase family protein [Sulfurimonas sp.]|uniref:L,D-transpeptidase family protein n=1 Tax=Sulfurimonas sp. TaxID=2022749 RepID=UPI002AB30884|nr:L,D-transpeptidase family protein [Sulfurimonas sp.]